MSSLNGANVFGLQGFMNLEVHNKRNGVVRHYQHNLITKAGKQYFLDGICGRTLGMNASTFGNTMTLNGMNLPAESGFSGHVYDSSRSIANVLLNLGESVNSITENTTYIPVFNSDFKSNKIIGYATSNVNPIADGKEGSIDYSRGEYVVDPFTVAERWKYPEGVGTGTIDAIAMMPMGSTRKDGLGFKFAKCLDRVNLQYSNYVSQSTGFLPPGVAGYTANDEILLNFNQDGTSKWKYNITTGEMKAVAAEDSFYVLEPTSVFDFISLGGYHYVVTSLGSSGFGGSRITVTVYDSNFSSVDYYNCSTGFVAGLAKFFIYGEDLYLSCCGDTKSSTSNANTRLFKLTNNGKLWKSYPNDASLFEVVKIPAGFGTTLQEAWNVCIGSYGSKYVMYVGIQDYMADYNKENVYLGYVFTDLKDIGGTILDCIQGIGKNCLLFSSPTYSGMLGIGAYPTAFSGINNTVFSKTYDSTNAKKMIRNLGTETKVNTGDRGCWLSLDGWWCNALSIVKLNAPIEITDEDIVYVSYGYKIV